MNILLPIEISLAAGVLFLFLPERTKSIVKVLSVLLGLLTFVFSILVFVSAGSGEVYSGGLPLSSQLSSFLLVDPLSRLIYLAIGFFGFLISLYASAHLTEHTTRFFAYFFLTLGSALMISISNNLIVLLCFWGFLGMTLYALVQLGSEGANQAAKKSLIIIGASDAFLTLGIGILWSVSNTFQIDELYMATNSPLLGFSFICFAIASFAKAGNMPFHTWIPAVVESAPISVTAYLPASLDKLLGIYLLARCVISIYWTSLALSLFLVVLGALTIVFAAFMALIQTRARNLLAYDAVGQVGYMVLGIGTLSPIGIAGALFHMVNHALYKSCLFLGLGGIERKRGTDNLDSLGGLARKMPLTLFTMLTASLAASGIPPLNGFFSKWLVYQGVIETFGLLSPLIPALCLILALFGSALTLAVFMKLIHSIFLAKEAEAKYVELERASGFSILFPQVVLATACLSLGIFARPLLINPALARLLPLVGEAGIWQPQSATVLIITGMVLGAIIYGASRIRVRVTSEFIGGEEIAPEMRVSGAGFYLTIEQLPFFSQIYQLTKRRFFDIYEVLRTWMLFFARVMRLAHSGSLPLYLLWLLVGVVVLLLIK